MLDPRESDARSAEQGSANRPTDRTELDAADTLRAYFAANPTRVFCSRHIEVAFEDRFFHWITHRAIRTLTDEGTITMEQRQLSSGAPVNVVWDRRLRYPRRAMRDVLSMVEEYSHPDFTAALGNTGELLVSDGFGRFGFVQRGRNVREFGGRRWSQSAHNLDFMFERDGRAYGVEVKNTLPYIHDAELRTKLALCRSLEVIPVFVVRAMPRIWIQEIARHGGFTLVLRYHLYPLSHRRFAERVRTELGIPVDAPRALYDGTVQRFLSWHERQLVRQG